MPLVASVVSDLSVALFVLVRVYEWSQYRFRSDTIYLFIFLSLPSDTLKAQFVELLE